jgi:hypothetical protein
MSERTFALGIIWIIVLGVAAGGGWYLYGFFKDHVTCGRIIERVGLQGREAQDAYADCIRKLNR